MDEAEAKAEAEVNSREAKVSSYEVEAGAKIALIFSANVYIFTPFSQKKIRSIFDETSKISAQNGL